MTKKNIIYLEKGNVSVIRHNGKQIEFIKRDGEVDFPITVDFWSWWKEAVSLLEDDDVDLCFIYDKEYDLLKDVFLEQLNKTPEEKTIWDINYLKSFFWELKPTYFSVVLIGPEGQEYVLNGNNKKDATQKRFYTTLNFSTQNVIPPKGSSENDESPGNINEEDISPIAKYFIDLIRKERGYDN